MKVFAFIESNTTGTGRLLAQRARAKGYRVLFLTQRPDRYPFLREDLIHPLLVDTSNPEAVASVLTDEDVAAVATSSEYYLEVAAKVSQRLGLVGANPEAVRCCRDKAALYRTLAEAGVAVPRTKLIRHRNEAENALKEMAWPLVIKPVAGSGSMDVRLHHEPESFFIHIDRLLAKRVNERGLALQPQVLVQSFVDGAEYSVETLCLGPEKYRPLGITRKHLGAVPYFLELGHDFPAALPDHQERQLHSLVMRALTAVGMDMGPCHTEIRIGLQGPVLIEINPRLAGGMIPILMNRALGWDVLEAWVDLYSGRIPKSTPASSEQVSIAFLATEGGGRLSSVTGLEAAKKEPGIVAVDMTKPIGYVMPGVGDFRDRWGHVIASSSEERTSREVVLRARARIHAETLPPSASADGDQAEEDTGRLDEGLHPEIRKIIRASLPARALIEKMTVFAAIDEAHALMLLETGLMDRDRVHRILREIQALKRSDFLDLQDRPAPRGLYLLYENHLVELLGHDGGRLHMGRSRNDINATMFGLQCRKWYADLAKCLWRLRDVLIQAASKTVGLFMPIYSQYQPGLPGTPAHVLSGVAAALSRDQSNLFQWCDQLAACPMGACAGGGTTFPIQPGVTAGYLGFERPIDHALDAVASRDLGVRLLGLAATIGMTVSRLAQDLQLWSTREFEFIHLPDNLAGGSSMMPQKKNPYLLEMIKGKAMRPGHAWSQALQTMTRVPFGNSVEVGTEAVQGMADGFRACLEALTIMTLVVEGIEWNPVAMERSGERGLVQATAVADLLVQQGSLSFREAHHLVGRTVKSAMAKDDDPRDAVMQLLGDPALAEMTLMDWTNRFSHGGGPAQTAVAARLKEARERLHADGSRIGQQQESWQAAEQLRTARVTRLINNELSREPSTLMGTIHASTSNIGDPSE